LTKTATMRSTVDKENEPLLQMTANNNNDIIEQDEKYIFRTIHRDDLHDLRTLQLELFPVKYTKKFYLSLLDMSNTFTVLAIERETDKIIGVCSARVFEESHFEWCGFKYTRVRMGYIMTLGVSPSHRRKGLASKMLEMLERRMLLEPYNVTKLTLHCKVDNNQALSFYKTFGFYIAQKIKNYYDFNGRYEDAYQLVRDVIIQNEDSTNVVVDDVIIEDQEDSGTILFFSRFYMIQLVLSYAYKMSSMIARYTFYFLDYCRNVWTPGNNRYYSATSDTFLGGLFNAFKRFISSPAVDPDDEDNDQSNTIDSRRQTIQQWPSITTAKKRYFLNHTNGNVAHVHHMNNHQPSQQQQQQPQDLSPLFLTTSTSKIEEKLECK
jgi:ribosomal protein S18 acetylase RimI-like enzyme